MRQSYTCCVLAAAVVGVGGDGARRTGPLLSAAAGSEASMYMEGGAAATLGAKATAEEFKGGDADRGGGMG